MRYLSIFMFVLLFVPSFAAGGEPLTPRPLDPIAADAFIRARADSVTVRSLVATLEASNVIVHIESSRMLPLGIVGTTRFVTSRGGYRYVRITIATDLSKTGRSAILAHELQHACELAQSNADDADSVRELFEREGHRLGAFVETRAAIDAERLVRGELGHRGTRLQAERLVNFEQ